MNDELHVKVRDDEDASLAIARTVIRPTVQAAATVKTVSSTFDDLALGGLIEALTEQTEAVIERDSSRSEAMLAAQAHTLDAIFNELARRAIDCAYLNKAEKFLRLALRAQAQSRATWETLSAIQNPSVINAQQANIAQGHQQVNNFPQDKLLEKNDGERLDTGTTGATGGVDTPLEALGTVDRA